MQSKRLLLIVCATVALLISGYFVFSPAKKLHIFSPSQTSFEGEVKSKQKDRFVMAYKKGKETTAFTIRVTKHTQFAYAQGAVQDATVPAFAQMQVGQEVMIFPTEKLSDITSVILEAKKIVLPSLYVQIRGHIHKIVPPTFYITTERPSKNNSQASVKQEYMVVVDPNKTITKKIITLKEAGPVEAKKEVSLSEIEEGITIDCIIKTTNVKRTVGNFVSGEVVEVGG